MTNLFIVDVDHTLFDAKKFEQAEVQVLSKFVPVTLEKLAEAKRSVRDQDGRFTLEQLVSKLLAGVSDFEQAKQRSIDEIYKLPFETYLYEGAAEAVRNLTNYGKVIVFSQGEELLQSAKVRALIVGEILTSDDIFIHTDKLSQIVTILEKYKDRRVFVFDDHKYYLAEFQKHNAQVITVLIETQETASDRTNPFMPMLAAKDLSEAVTKVEELLRS